MKRYRRWLTFVLLASLLIGCTGWGGPSEYSVSGRIVDGHGTGISSVLLSFNEGEFGTAETDSAGKWRKDGLKGTVTINAAKDGWEFESKIVTKASTNVDFIGIKKTYNLNIETEGQGVVNEEVLSIVASANYGHGTKVQLTAVPAAGWRFSHWEGDLEGSKNPAEIVVDMQKSVTAVFVSNLIYVPQQYGTIQAAIDSAVDGNVIIIAPGRYRENLLLSGKNITLQSTNPSDSVTVESTILDGDQKDAVIRIENCEIGVTIAGLTIENGIGELKEGLRYGGGVNSSNSSITLCKNIVRGNQAYFGGGIYYTIDPGLTHYGVFTDNVIVANSAGNYGGALYVERGIHAFTDNTINENVARYGGAIYTYYGTHDFTRNTMTENSANMQGGFLCTYYSNIVFTDNIITFNSAGEDGGAFCTSSGECTYSNNIITGNSAGTRGGALYAQHGTHGFINNIICDNSANLGGAFFTKLGKYNFDKNTMERNSATYSGGVMHMEEGNHTYTNNIIMENFASEEGGAFYVYWSTATYVDNIIANNSAGKRGGALYAFYQFSVTLISNTLSENSAGEKGGAVFIGTVATDCRVAIANNRFVSNQANDSGGAIWVFRRSLMDPEGNPISIPDSLNTYSNNYPDDIFLSPPD